MSMQAMRNPQPSAPVTEDERHALGKLHTRILDIAAGFDTMLDKAEPRFLPVVRRFADLHRDQAAAVAALLGPEHTDLGGESLMATVNRTVVSLRSFFDEIDADTLSQIHSGEEHVLDAYDEAIRVAADPRRVELQRLKGDLARLIADTRAPG